ncbi:LysR family transcriptional regulator [Hwanghaeella grinnelliae]|uniref:LysR family transcriptional regulator n=1 Tax=Hwanghaeella grinnelliae TaxID=2500179 RepID=A0A3S2WCW1_9PROT|nr:LysR family transcriptional regulator [Hwanghaeella grinnelliae]RVU39496.1 LysR family transcriptional regulator [Hwanghaeella grinnelliae]
MTTIPVKLDVDSLRALKSVADHGGVTRAAHHLSLSQSAISHKIKRLEDHIDCRLLNRRSGLPLLTDTGERLLGYANRILALHDEAAATLSRRTLAGNIRMGMTEDMTSSGLAQVLARFARVFPDVSVRVHVAQSQVLQEEVENAAIDLGVMQVFAQDVRPDDTVLFRHRLCWAKAKDFDLPDDGPVPFLAYDDRCFYKAWLVENAGTMGRAFRTVLECSSNAGILAGIDAGLGVSIVNEEHLSATMEEVSGDVFRTPPDIAYVVRLAAKPASNAVGALRDGIAQEAGEGEILKIAL